LNLCAKKQGKRSKDGRVSLTAIMIGLIILFSIGGVFAATDKPAPNVSPTKETASPTAFLTPAPPGDIDPNDVKKPKKEGQVNVEPIQKAIQDLYRLTQNLNQNQLGFIHNLREWSKNIDWDLMYNQTKEIFDAEISKNPEDKSILKLRDELLQNIQKHVFTIKAGGSVRYKINLGCNISEMGSQERAYIIDSKGNEFEQDFLKVVIGSTLAVLTDPSSLAAKIFLFKLKNEVYENKNGLNPHVWDDYQELLKNYNFMVQKVTEYSSLVFDISLDLTKYTPAAREAFLNANIAWLEYMGVVTPDLKEKMIDAFYKPNRNEPKNKIFRIGFLTNNKINIEDLKNGIKVYVPFGRFPFMKVE
jgi:hypothetical protein